MDESLKQQKKLQRRMAAQRKRTHNVLLIAAFLLVVVLFAIINLCVRDKEYSDTENRSLAQKPAFSWQTLSDGSLFSGLTSHFSDQFFLRDKWISLKLREESLLGRKEAGGVYLCADDYLMSPPETPNQEAIDASVAAINTFAQSYPDVTMRVMLVPSAAVILPEHLPKNAPVRDQLQDIQDIAAKLDSSVIFLDAAKPLTAQKEEYIYYKTDHHWTSLGALYTFRSLAAAMGVTVNTDYKAYPVTDSFEGTLSSKSGSHATTDTIEVYAPTNSNVEYYVTYPDSTEKVCSIYRSAALAEKDKYTVFFGGNHSIVEIKTTANNDRSLLLFKDSYANCFVQFLIPYYENIVMIDPRYYYDNVNSIMNNYGITDVLYLYSADTFVTTTALTDVLSSGVQEEAPVTVPEETFGSIPEETSVVEDSTVEQEASVAEESVIETP